MTRDPRTEEHRDGVEEATHARRGDGAGSFGERQDRGQLGGVDRGNQRSGVEASVHRPHGGHAPRLADRRDTAGHRRRAEVCDAFEAAEVGDDHLATPHGSVGAVAEAVEGEPDDRIGAAVLDHARRHMRVVVLHTDRGELLLGCMLRRQVLGVKVVRDDLGAHAVERREMLNGLEKRGVRGEMLEVAEMMARHDRRTLRDGDRALELGSEGKDRSAGLEGKQQWFRRVAARAAQQLESTSRDPTDRVVATDVDHTVV